MGDKIRVDIELGICNNSGPRRDTFVAAQLIAYDTMNEACTQTLNHSFLLYNTINGPHNTIIILKCVVSYSSLALFVVVSLR